MSRELKTPPPFVRCEKCIDEDIPGSVLGVAINGFNMRYTCPNCGHSPLPGWLPQWYTTEQWVEYVKRENGISNYKLPDDIMLWTFWGDHWDSDAYLAYKLFQTKRIGVIATAAGRPPLDWRPE